MRVAAAALSALLCWVIARTAWVSDDAYVTLRTLDQLVHGNGLVYNAVERVQAYTHPLWMLLLAGPYALTGDAWRMVMGVGAAVTLLGVGVLAWRVASGASGVVVALGALIGSKSFVDYATSGLENPLEDLLLAVFAAGLLRERPNLLLLVFVASLLGTTRPDAVLLVLPALAVVAGRLLRAGERGAVGIAAAGVAPLVAWHGFALVYYGSILPNTAYAKLGTGIPAGELLAQGLRYLLWTARVDPITLVGTAFGVVVGLRSRDLRELGLVLGIALHLLYVVRIGGDFMGGRFLVAPLWVAALLLAREPWTPRVSLGLAAAFVLGSLAFPHAPLRSGPDYARAKARDGVVDERGYYWRGTGWWVPRDGEGPDHEFARDGRAARGDPLEVKSVIGLYGYYAGPGHHVVDRLGLAEPLLARLPAEHDPDWRIGHFRRRIPEGHLASVRSSRNGISDAEARELAEAVRQATRGELWTAERWRAIARLHLGSFPLDRERWRYGDVRWVEAGAEVIEVGRRGAGVRLEGAGVLRVELGPGEWDLWLERGDKVLERRTAEGTVEVPFDGVDRLLAVPAERGTFSASIVD